MDPRSDEARLKFFGRRKGRSLKPSQQGILDQRLPVYALDPEAMPKNPRELFIPSVDSVQMEIGFGSGEHLVAQAQANPTVGYIGCEPFINGVVKLVRDLDKAKVNTVRVYVMCWMFCRMGAWIRCLFCSRTPGPRRVIGCAALLDRTTCLDWPV